MKSKTLKFEKLLIKNYFGTLVFLKGRKSNHAVFLHNVNIGTCESLQQQQQQQQQYRHHHHQQSTAKIAIQMDWHWLQIKVHSFIALGYCVCPVLCMRVCLPYAMCQLWKKCVSLSIVSMPKNVPVFMFFLLPIQENRSHPRWHLLVKEQTTDDDALNKQTTKDITITHNNEENDNRVENATLFFVRERWQCGSAIVTLICKTVKMMMCARVEHASSQTRQKLEDRKEEKRDIETNTFTYPKSTHKNILRKRTVCACVFLLRKYKRIHAKKENQTRQSEMLRSERESTKKESNQQENRQQKSVFSVNYRIFRHYSKRQYHPSSTIDAAAATEAVAADALCSHWTIDSFASHTHKHTRSLSRRLFESTHAFIPR